MVQDYDLPVPNNLWNWQKPIFALTRWSLDGVLAMWLFFFLICVVVGVVARRSSEKCNGFSRRLMKHQRRGSAENEPPTGYEPNDHFLTEACVEYPRANSGSLMTSTSMTSPSARRSLMRAEDEPITLKKKACRPVCRRQSVMIERRDPLFAHLCRAPKKFRDTALKINRLGLSWIDKESRF